MIASPKTITQKYPNTPNSILRKNIILTNAIDKASRILPNFCPLTSLYALNLDFPHIRKSRDLLAIEEGFVLVNYTDLVTIPWMESEIIELIYSGYKPILIHPERYTSLHGDMSFFKALVSRGCFLSLLSLQEVHGRACQKIELKLLENHL